MRYFDTSAKHHHSDEEEDLFPMLLQAAPESEHAHLRELVDALLAQHRELELAWSQVRWKLEGVWLGMQPDLGAEEVGRLVELYRVHIAREEEELLPLAARLLGDAQLDVVGRAMRERRGIKDV
jgi:hemerythrin-like domain-containing protein